MRNRLLVIADTHLATKYPLSTDPFPFADPFFVAAIKALNQAHKYAFDNDCDIMHAGDLFHSDEIGAPELFAAVQFFRRVTHAGGTIFFDPGNHEISFQNPIPSVSQSLSYAFPRVWTPGIKEEWTVKPWQHAPDRLLNIYLVPYYKESVFNDALKKLVAGGVKQPAALCIHQNIKGIQVGNAVLQDGMGEDEICNLVKDKFKFVVCGHIHHRMVSERYGVPLIIPGSTISMDFRDEGSTKSFNVLEFDKKYNIKDIKTVDIEGQIVFRSMDLDDVINRGIEFDKRFFRISAPISKNDELKLFEKKALSFGAIGVQPKWIKARISRQPQGFERPVSMGIDDWLVQYMKKKGCNDSEISKAIETNKKIFKPEV